MPREGAIIFRDSAKKLDVLRGERGKCGHVGQYRAAPWSRYRSGHGAKNVAIVRASRSCVPKPKTRRNSASCNRNYLLELLHSK